MTHAGLGTDQTFGGSPNDVTLTDGFRFAFRATFNTEGIFGHEVQYSYQRTHLQFNDQSETPSRAWEFITGDTISWCTPPRKALVSGLSGREA